MHIIRRGFLIVFFFLPAVCAGWRTAVALVAALVAYTGTHNVQYDSNESLNGPLYYIPLALSFVARRL